MANISVLRDASDLPDTVPPAPRSQRSRSAKAIPHRIVIVGGGAGGIELATRLGNRMTQDGRVHVVLVDKSATHLWKPLLHEIAAGTLDANIQQLDYIAQARWHHFEFQQGELVGLDRKHKTITVAPVQDADLVEVLPARYIAYDTLVLAIGSVTNFFHVPGAADHAIALDNVCQAEQFRRRMIAACMRTQHHLHHHRDHERPRVDIVIIGAGATGVELAAELRGTAEVLGAYGLHDLDPRRDIHITLIETGPRILGPLPEKIATETTQVLRELGIGILTSEKVTHVHEHAVLTESGKILPSDLTVWAGGIQVAKILADLGLPVNKLGQVRVGPTLQLEADPDIFALGDCAECAWPETGKTVPPRAQAAHQQARHLYRALSLHIAGKALPSFSYRDHGSLVSLGRFNAVGNLMGKLAGRSLMVEGLLARWLYAALYRMHLVALHGIVKAILTTFAQWLQRKTRPRIKLH